LAIILDAEYEGLGKARVSLVAADGNDDNGDISANGFHWEKRGEVFHSDDDTEDQHISGEIGFYLSDFLGTAGLPAAYVALQLASPGPYPFLSFLLRPCLLIRPALSQESPI
jgi:hypothetical protein